MAVITSSTTQNLSATAFAAGDQIVVTAGTLTIDSSVSAGTSPPGTPDGASAFVPTISASAGGTVTSLPTGSYAVVYTNVDSGGKESSRSPESAAVTLTNGTSKPRVTLPALPPGVTSRKLYLKAAGGAALSETLYATGITGTTYDLVSASWTDGTTTQAAAAAFPNASAIQVNTGASLTVNSGVTLTLKGDLRVTSTGDVVLSAGSTLKFDASASASPSDTPYNGWIGQANGSASATITCNGTSVSRVTITSDAGGANGGFLCTYSVGTGGSNTDCGNWAAAYTDFSRLGSATRGAITSSQQSSGSTTFSFSHCTFDACGQIQQAYSVPTGASWSFDYVGFTNSLDPTYNVRLNSATSPTGARRIDHCSFDMIARFPVSNTTLTNSYLSKGWELASTVGTMAGLSGNLVRQTGAVSGMAVYGGDSNSYWLADTTTDNPHILIPQTAGTYDGLIFEYAGSHGSDGGEAFLNSATGAGGRAVTIKNTIVLPSGGGDDMSGAINLGSDFVATITHNTLCAGQQGGVATGELTQAAGTYATYKSNLVWWKNGGTTGSLGPLKVWKSPANTVQDAVTPSGAQYNAGLNLLTGTAGKGYSGSFSTSPGDNDIDLGTGVDESTVFADPTRNIATWAVTRGSASGTYAGKVADALAYLSADTTLISDLVSHVRAGFVPTDATLKDAGHDGVTIGAVEGVFGPTYVEGEGSSSGVSTGTGVGSSITSGLGATSGISDLTGVGSSLVMGVGAVTGVGVSLSVGSSTSSGEGISQGLSTPEAAGASVVSSIGSSQGISSVLGESITTLVGVGMSSGSSTVLGVSDFILPAELTSGPFVATRIMTYSPGSSRVETYP